MNTKFDVVIRGVRNGFNKNEVASSLASLLKSDLRTSLLLLEKKEFTLKKDVNRENGERYQSVLEKIGRVSEILCARHNMMNPERNMYATQDQEPIAGRFPYSGYSQRIA